MSSRNWESTIIRRLSIAILVLLSACASIPSDNDVSKRKASWQGVPVVELVTALGGQPGLKKNDTWYWQFWASPEKRDSYIQETESLSQILQGVEIVRLPR